LPPLPRAPNETYHVHARHEADGVDNAVGTHDGGRYGALVVCIGGDLFEAVALGPDRMSRGDAHRGAGPAQMARDATANKTSPTEHRYAAYFSIHPLILRDALD
jgi:hypothetical protein